MQDSVGNLGYQGNTPDEKTSKYPSSAKTLDKIIQKGQISIIESEIVGLPYAIFSEMAKKGYDCMAIVRSRPEAFKQDYGLDATVHWLSTLNSVKDSINPNNYAMDTLNDIRKFITTNPKGIILFEGIEYVTTQNTIDHFLRWLNVVADEIAINKNSRFILTYDPLAFDTTKRQLIKKSGINVTADIDNHFGLKK